MLSFLLMQSANADIPSEIAVAADKNLPEESRQAAFDRVVAEGRANTAVLVQASLDGEDTPTRWVAIRALGHVGGQQVQQTLLELLSDPEPAIRSASIGALAEVGSRSHSGRIAQLLTDPAILVRATAARALGELRDPSTLYALDDALSASDNYYRGTSLWVRPHFVMAMGEIGDARALPALMRGLDDDAPDVVDASLRALEQISGVSFADGRTPEEEREAWRRWAIPQIQQRGLR